MNKIMKDPLLAFTIGLVFLVVGIFVVYPLYNAVQLTFVKHGNFSCEIWKKVLTTSSYLKPLWGSVLLGILTATASTLLGFLFAYCLTRMTMRGAKFFDLMATIPIISPPFSLTLSIILLLGDNGLITKQLFGLKGFSVYGLHGLVLVQTMCMFPIAYMVLRGVLQNIDSSMEDAAMNLGANRWKAFFTVTAPLAFPGISSAWLLVFMTSMADFANPLLLAGQYKVLSVEAYLEVAGMNRLANGTVLSILLLIPSLLAFAIQRYWISQKVYITVTGKSSGRIMENVNKPVKVMLTLMLLGVVLFISLLYGTLVAGCFVKNWGIDFSFSTENITEAVERGSDALKDTIILALIATPIAGILAMIVAFIIVRKAFCGKRWLEMFVLLPFAIPGTLIGISYVIAFNKPPFLLVGTGAIIVINYIIRELPVGVESGIAMLKQIHPSMEESAQNLGADTPTVFSTITLPLIKPALISSLSYTFVRAMTAVSAVIFLISANWYHVTVQIYNFSENLRFGLASVLSTLLILIILAVFIFIRVLVGRNEHMEKILSSKGI